MVFGIDFGTTFTVVAWMDLSIQNEGSQKFSVNFLEWNGLENGLDGEFLYPTKINRKIHLKRLLANSTKDYINQDSAIYKDVLQFFINIKKQIEEKFQIYGIKECVLTVPARFDDLARNAIKAAAVSAGFHVLKLLAEPVAAAIYALGHEVTIPDRNTKSKKGLNNNGYYIVYDLGGGTFDATLLKLHDGVFQILAISGIPDFGGLDIDRMLSDKKNISINQAVEYKEQGNFTNQEEHLINDMLAPTYEIIDSMLAENGLNKLDINGLILAGGSSKLQMIYETLSKMYLVLQTDLRADLVVAAGAAVHGKMLADNLSGNLSSANHLLIDVIPFDLGIETLGDQMEVLIAKNSPLPAMYSQYFQPVHGSKVLVHILQGVDCKASEATSLAKFEIQAIDPFEVVFMIDCDGILSIKINDIVHIVSAKFGMQTSENVKKNHVLEQLLQNISEYCKLKNIEDSSNYFSDITHEQKQYIEYLKQARKIELSSAALEWLIEQHKKLF